MADGGSAREAAERNAAAVMAGDIAQVMADLTPEALAQLMQLGAAAAGGVNPAAMPGITGYEVVARGAEDGGEVFEVTFNSPAGRATLAATWKPVLGGWKIAAVALVAAEAAEGPAS